MSLAKSTTTAWLKTFFEEKSLENRIYEVRIDGEVHLIETNFVIELISNAPESERVSIRHVLAQIDMHNGDVHHFLKHLAHGYVATSHR